MHLYEGRIGPYETFNPPFVTWVVGLADALIPGTSLYVATVAALAAIALAVVTSIPKYLHPAGLLAMASVALLPQTFLYQSIVWKDVLFANSVILLFALLALASARPEDSRRRRTSLLTASLILAVVAALTRQNGVVVIPFAAACTYVVSRTVYGRRRSAAFSSAWMLAAVLVLMAASPLLNSLREDGESATGVGTRVLLHYDIWGMVARDADANLGALENPELAADLRASADSLFSSERVDTLGAEGAPSLWAIDEQHARSTWASLVRTSPTGYLAHRWSVFKQVAATPRIEACLPIHVGVGGPPDRLQAIGIPEGVDAQDQRLYGLASVFVGTPAFSHITFALAGTILGIGLLLRRRAEDLVIVMLLACVATITMSYFFISLACDYRYLYFLDLAVILAFVYAAASLPPRFVRHSTRRIWRKLRNGR